MRFLESPSPVLALIGPTAVGKTELSIQLAEALSGEIVSGDSRLFYRGMDIGTAKPTAAERQRAPHHLIDVSDPDQTWNLALYQAEAEKAIKVIQARRRLPILVGGTGQYIWSLVENWRGPELAPDPRLRQVLEDWAGEIGPEALYQRLRRIDPDAAAHIEPRNLRRTVRALEVIFRSGRRFSEQRGKFSSDHQWLIIGLSRSREDLYHRVDRRIEEMVANGFVEEVRMLLGKGYSRQLPSLSAIGYREICAALAGEISLEEAVRLIKQSTRQFVRRQANWFKTGDPRIHWFDAANTTAADIAGFIREAQFPE
ncbi:MAG TPA: tRNA (adenosine(37)-N6)-dimethylallyltransferase MiaA [Anaerolineaceae bacterium]